MAPARKAKGAAETTGGGHSSEPPSSNRIFSDGEDNIVPGEVLVELHGEVAGALEVPVPLRTMSAMAATTSLGVSDLDRVLSDIGTTSITRIHGAMPNEAVDGMSFAASTPLTSAFRVRFDPDQDVGGVVERLSGLDQVAVAEPNRWRETCAVPNDPQFAAQWGLTKISCPTAWDRTTGSASVVVAIVDTGIDLDHPELSGLLVSGQDLVDLGPNPTPKPGWVFEGDFQGVDNSPQDEVGHGTHVAGTVACASNNGTGVAGVTWACRLMPVRVLARTRRLSDNAVSGSGSAADIAAGIRWAADHGAHVINMSLGGYVDTTVERNAVAYAISQGVVVVAAMANDNVATPSFPAAYPDVIAVGATDSADHRAWFSNTGPHIDVAAPGVGIVSTYWDNTYASLDGTSMATPHVAGVVALIRSVNTTLTAAQVGQIIRDTATPLRDQPADPVPNDRYGSGLVNAAAAVQRAAPVLKSLPICRRSVIEVCVPLTTMITCHKSVIVCPPTTPLGCNLVSRRVVCPPSVAFPCRSLPLCPSGPIGCGPSGPVCGDPGRPGGPGGPGELDELGVGEGVWDDPYGDDPYGSWYGE